MQFLDWGAKWGIFHLLKPTASNRLEKIGFKQICDKVGAPTPKFVVLAEDSFRADLTDKGTKEQVVQDQEVKTRRNEALQEKFHGGTKAWQKCF